MGRAEVRPDGPMTRRALYGSHGHSAAGLMGVPLPCQKQPTMKDNREHSGDIHTAPELSTRSSRARGRQPDKDEVGGSSPPRPTSAITLTQPLLDEPCASLMRHGAAATTR